MEYIATCLFGLEKYLGEEIDALGLKRVETMDGRITFSGEAIDCARANLNLRTAERVLIKVGSFPARTFTELFDGVKALPWETFIGAEDAFPVKGHSIRSLLTSVPDCQSIIKKAVVSRLQESYPFDRFPETGVKYQIEFFLFRDIATLMIDTSGEPLHKRGYRPNAGGAPLRETLAAAMAMNAHLKEEILLWDPFCGSGTILIEAVMLMNRIAPGLDRSFAAERFPQFPPELWQKARDEAEGNICFDSSFEAWGSDIDDEVLAIARDNAARAGVADQIRFFHADVRDIKKPENRKGTILTNPPYGERLLTPEEAAELYRAVGRNFRSFDPWQIYFLTMSETFEREYGRRADKVRKLYNGMIPCNLYQFYLPKEARLQKGADRPDYRRNMRKGSGQAGLSADRRGMKPGQRDSDSVPGRTGAGTKERGSFALGERRGGPDAQNPHRTQVWRDGGNPRAGKNHAKKDRQDG